VVVILKARGRPQYAEASHVPARSIASGASFYNAPWHTHCSDLVRWRPRPFLFDLDGTLVDSVYQHVLAWRAALEETKLELAVWRMS
jgi:hypothetical protein